MMVSIIVAAAKNGVIGNKGKLPWHLPSELARFKQITIGHPIVMGRKTHESIGRALPGRQNIVISRDPNYQAEGCETTDSLTAALKLAGDSTEVFIIGGASIYNSAMPMTDKIYLTRVDANPAGDKKFEFDESNWKLVSSDKFLADDKNPFGYEIQEWVKK
ncbi:dihydrofolate reductase [Candidatus Saccharibacteria bacterium]|nr:dihydrofolate reductase [Candidatus Saccharibacteria bacterium]